MDNNLQAKFAQFVKKEECKKKLKIVLICIGALILVGAGAYLVYRFFFAKEEEYDLYDELDFYYDDDEEAEEEASPEAEEEAAAEEASQETAEE